MINFENDSFIDIFVGKNASGKSNFFEALIEIFRHLYEFPEDNRNNHFDYKIIYKLNGDNTEIAWNNNGLEVNNKRLKTVNHKYLPDNILVYYTGHNRTVIEIINKYQERFSKKIKDASIGQSRKFIGIGTEYKGLLQAIMLLIPEESIARKYTCETMDSFEEITTVQIILKRPNFADKNFQIDPFDPATHFWGPQGVMKEFLKQLTLCIKDSFNHGTIYDKGRDLYTINIDRSLFNKVFSTKSPIDLFWLFDNLKTLDMIASFHSIDESGNSFNLSNYSDGQFQIFYIYSIVEIFKDKNCLVLLDEPDSFLHPEWQFKLIHQTNEIARADNKNSHILLSSHNAVTIMKHSEPKIRFFDIENKKVNSYLITKQVAVKKLSSEIIRYSEQHNLLSILNTIQIENKPVLFTEGSTDPLILTEAWYQLFEEEIPFIPFYAFSSTYINQLLTDDRIHNEMGGKPLFALFDFDKAFNQWNGLNGKVIENNIFNGLIKKWKTGESYAFMIPVPKIQQIKEQVVKTEDPFKTYCDESCCEIEHLFYCDNTEEYFDSEPVMGGGSKIVFKHDNKKTKFAKEVIPKMDKKYFEVFRPMFEFIKEKCDEKCNDG